MSFHVLGIGEVLWDLLPDGPKVGGAPANFAYHARALGATAHVVTRVGADERGRAIVRQFQQQGIADGTMQLDPNAPTGTVTVALSATGIPAYTIRENVAWDHIEAAPSALCAIQGADAVCFGSVAQRSEISRAAIQRMLAAASPETLRIFDINLRQKYYSRQLIEDSLFLANVLKLNEEELCVVAELFGLGGSTRQCVEFLAQKFGLRLVALTRGPRGSLLYQGGQWSDCPSTPVVVVDTVGAGDAFTAALALGILQKMELDEINAVADEVARYVCSCAGATPPLPKKFAERFQVSHLTTKSAVKGDARRLYT